MLRGNDLPHPSVARFAKRGLTQRTRAFPHLRPRVDAACYPKWEDMSVVRRLKWSSVALALLGVACGQSPSSFVADAAADTPDADPFSSEPESCKLSPAVMGAQIAENCAPCAGRDFAEGASCFDLPKGFQCEEGDHPDSHCNSLWECNENLEWHLFQPRQVGHQCAREVMQGKRCDSRTSAAALQCSDLPPQTPCLSSAGDLVAWLDSDYVVASTTRYTRLGCPCLGTGFIDCHTGEKCVDRRVEIMPLGPLPCGTD